MATGTFVTAINCMDGRAILPVTEWMKQQFHVDYVDMITEAGPDKVLSKGNYDQVKSIKDRVLVSVEKHGSKVVAIVAHHDCAGNPVSKEEHLQHLQACIDTLNGWRLRDVRILALWLDELWVTEVIYDSTRPA